MDYMMPIGLHHIFAFDEHYGPEPDGFNPNVPLEWCPTYYHKANKDSIGFDRTHTGSNATAQYREPYCSIYDNINTCPERYLLWFHRVPWSYRLKSGKTVFEEMTYRYNRGVGEVEDFLRVWQDVKPLIDDQRWQEVQERLEHQLDNAKLWRKTCLDYFGRGSSLLFSYYSFFQGVALAGGFPRPFFFRALPCGGYPQTPSEGLPSDFSINPNPFFIRRGFEPLPKPLANRWQGDVIDSGQKPPSVKGFLYGSQSLCPFGASHGLLHPCFRRPLKRGSMGRLR